MALADAIRDVDCREIDDHGTLHEDVFDEMPAECVEADVAVDAELHVD